MIHYDHQQQALSNLGTQEHHRTKLFDEAKWVDQRQNHRLTNSRRPKKWIPVELQVLLESYQYYRCRSRQQSGNNTLEQGSGSDLMHFPT